MAESAQSAEAAQTAGSAEAAEAAGSVGSAGPAGSARSGRRPTLDPASGAIRNAVRAGLGKGGTGAGGAARAVSRIVVAVSGGADSMALLHACAFLHRRGEVEAFAVTVDHGLQPGSAEVAAEVVATAESWGVPAEAVRVDVAAGPEGLEAGARDARYSALEAVRARVDAEWIVTAHTRSDQAETVLLGLLRGSGTRSLAGMAVRTGSVLRPLLDIDRATTEASCTAQRITVWDDPMNADRAYARVRVRSLLTSLETDLGQPVTDNLARTAQLCRADADFLDESAAAAVAEVSGRSEIPVERLGELEDAILTRVLRVWLVSLDVPAQAFGAARIAELTALIRANVNGRLSLPGDTEVAVSHGSVRFGPAAKSRRP